MRETVGAAVRRRLVADVPLGALLSGGIDSSVVVAEMARASAARVRTFTVGFGDDRYDERAYARAVAERYGTEHEEIVVEPDVTELLPAARARLRRAARRRGGAAAVPRLRGGAAARDRRARRRRRRRGVRRLRALRGGRARRPRGAAGRAALPRAPCAGQGAASRARARSARAGSSRSRRCRAERYGRLMEVFPADAARGAVGAGVRARSPTPAWELLGPPPDGGISGLQRLDVRTYLPGDLLLKADIASMAHSLELRSPLLDHSVLELGVSLPDQLKVDGPPGQGRAAAGVRRRAPAAGRGPRQDRVRRPARALVPRGAARRSRATSCSTSAPAHAGSCGRRAVERLLDEHVAGRADHGHRLWCLLMLELWQRDARRRRRSRRRGRVRDARPWLRSSRVVAAVPRLAVLLHERGDILAAFTEKSDDLAQVFVETGTFGFIPGEPSAWTQPLYAWFLIPIYWIFGRSWWAVGLIQIAVAVATALLVYEIGRRFVSPRVGLVAALRRDAEPVPRLARRPRQPRDPRPAARGRDRAADAAPGGPAVALARCRPRRRARPRDPRQHAAPVPAADLLRVPRRARADGRGRWSASCSRAARSRSCPGSSGTR